MQYNNFFTPLKINDPWNELDINDINKLNLLQGKHPFFDAKNFTIPKSIILLSKDLNLTIDPYCTFLFHCKPNATGPIHIDGDRSYFRHSAINWVWNGENSKLNWYNIFSEQKIRYYQNREIPYFDETNVNKTFSAIITECNLINVSLPHNVENYADTIRYTLSIGFNENLPYIDMYELLSKKGYTK